MKDLLGPGTFGSLVLRIGQCLFAACSFVVMASAHTHFDSTCFSALMISMVLQATWTFALACLDIRALRTKKDLCTPALLTFFCFADWILATISLAAACASSGVTVLYAIDLKFCHSLTYLRCYLYEISIALAFVAWFLLAMSSHANLWILASA